MMWWPKRLKNEPLWPTLRGAPLTPEHLERITTILDTVRNKWCPSWAVGKHTIRELPSGAFYYQGTPVEYPVLYLHLRIRVKTLKSVKKKAVLNCLCLLKGYQKGCIVHFAWEFPHLDLFWGEDLYKQALLLYCTIAKLVYGDRPMDKGVLKFIKSVEEAYSVDVEEEEDEEDVDQEVQPS